VAALMLAPSANRSWLAAGRAFAWCLLCLGACADGSEAESALTSVAVAAPYAPPASASPNESVASATEGLPPANWRDGLALRWQSDGNRCIARQNPLPTANELLTLEACANSNQQAWTLAGGKLAADGNLCVGVAASSNRLLMLPCSGPNVTRFVFNGGSISDAAVSNPPTYLYLDSNTGDVGSPILGYQSATVVTSNKASWNLTGVGSSLGAPFAFGGDANLCLRHEAGLLKLRACASADANQRWSFLRGDLANSANNCVVSSPSLPALAFVPCSSVSNTASANQGWYWVDFLLYASSDINGSYVLARAVENDLTAVELTLVHSDSRPFKWQIGRHFE
jgi:hypothetical protein